MATKRSKKASKKATRAAKKTTAQKVSRKRLPTKKKRASKKKASRQRVAKAAGKQKRVFWFGDGKADGHRGLRDLLGGKGANLAEMSRLGLPVPPGVTITTDVCTYYVQRDGKYPRSLKKEVNNGLRKLERSMKKRFGDPKNPLLVSVRSGARVSMPGMMDTVLNLGLNDTTVHGLAAAAGDPRFAWDAYRRFLQMYGEVVLGVRAASSSDEDPFSAKLAELKRDRGVENDTDLTVDDLRGLVLEFKQIVRDQTGQPFPEDPEEQLWGAIGAVFGSWQNDRAIAYRQMNGISDDWGTAVNIVAMVFGNLGRDSGTGVAFTRDPSTGEKRFYGEYLMNAQGEDVVAGIRTPEPISTLAEAAPGSYKQLVRIQRALEKHFRDMQDLEFTIERGKLYMLQCRVGKRTGFAAVRIAVEMVKERLITKEEALQRVEPQALNQLLQPVFDSAELNAARNSERLLTTGLNAGPGAASGRIVFTAESAAAWAERGETVLLCRIETSPEDIRGMQASVGILTARGGMTSHAALVARQMGKVCVAGAGEVQIDYGTRSLSVRGRSLAEGDWLSLDGSTGEVLEGRLETTPSEVEQVLSGQLEGGPTFDAFQQLMKWADAARTLGVRTNADQPDQCEVAVAYGAEGIGLCRTEHMFFGEGKTLAMRQMILAADDQARKSALAKLLPYQRADFEGIFEVMQKRPVTIRTLDPPLHEFLPREDEQIQELARDLGIDAQAVRDKVEDLHELNPMLGHRGCRLGIVYPAITRMQARAIMEAAVAVKLRTKVTPKPEIMIPLIGTARELALQAREVREVCDKVLREHKVKIPYLVGTMIEIPRAALTADEVAAEADFFSFGTNDLTQTTYGISRDDGGKFIPVYLEQEIYPVDPFASLDPKGVKRLMRLAVEDGRSTKKDLKLGICGEHGGDPSSIAHCQELGLDYVSCSPHRVPIARLAAAQAALK